VQKYISKGQFTTPSVCFIGRGGTGKTTLMKQSLLYCISQGLQVVITCLVAERSNKLEGIHIHCLFGIGSYNNISPNKLAEHAIVKLLKHGELYFLLKRIDVMFIDELGQINAQVLCAMDMIMRHIQKS